MACCCGSGSAGEDSPGKAETVFYSVEGDEKDLVTTEPNGGGRQASVYSGFGGDDAADADADAKLAVDSDPEGYVDEHGNRSGAHAGSKPERKASATSFCFEADCDDDFDVGLGNMASFDGGAQAGAGILHSFSSVQKYQGHGPRKMSSVLVHDNVAETAEHISKIYDGVPNASKTAVEKLGEGATANVYNLQHRKTKVNYACKLINLAAVGSQEKKDLLLREIPMLQELDHPNIIKIVEVFRVGDLVYIIMEKADGGELFDRLLEQPGSHYSESYTRKLCARILSALRYLHARNIVHRDLKLENVLFSADPSIAKHATVKLIDFGFSHVYLTGSVMTDLIGTPFYLAPEVLKQTYTDASSDMWSFGVIVYMLVTGDPPFDGYKAEEIMEAIKKAAEDPAACSAQVSAALKAKGVSDACTDFVVNLLEVNPDKRLTAPGACEHHWFKEAALLDDNPYNNAVTLDEHGVQRQAIARRATVSTTMMNFKNKSSLQKSYVLAVAFAKGSSNPGIVALREAFVEMDTNNDGAINYAEFEAGMRKKGIEDAAQIKESFDAIDMNKSGAIEYSQFLAAALNDGEAYTDANMDDAFYRLDVSQDGRITKDDLMAVLNTANTADKQLLEIAIAAADTNGDGVLDRKEFGEALRGKFGADNASLLASIDTNGDGQLSKGEINRAVSAGHGAHGGS